ncbi:MAG: acyltransferase [Methylocapsa sp.]|nr:acyltransferase [Methylocapsa sp.]
MPPALHCDHGDRTGGILPGRERPKFRHDINALRALAVGAVVLYHYKVSFIPGGFAGVDVFFVISGYLMTAIIAGRLAKDSFSIWQFYRDRARRIVPGLLGLCTGLLAAGYFLLEPMAYKAMGQESAAALLFVSNFKYWQGSSYFDPGTIRNWLLHTWSLSVEWQFYLLYPILLICLHKANPARRRIIPALWLLALFSFLLCVWPAKYHPESAFYLLPQRAWEMLAGGIVAVQFDNRQWKYPFLLLGAGFLAIGIAIFAFDATLAWPSCYALLPCIGTCLVIAANRPAASLFTNRLIQMTGRWSYAIYLWHWPVTAGAAYLYFVDTTALKIAAEMLILAAIISAGGVCLVLIQAIPAQFRVQESLPAAARGAIAFSIAAGFALLAANGGMPGRRPDIAKKLQAYADAAQDWNYPSECMGTDAAGNLRPCRLGAAVDSGVLIIGDSFAMHIYGRFADAAKFNPQNSFTFLASLGCPPVLGMRMIDDRYNCSGFFDKALQFAKARHFKRILLASRWNAYFRPQERWMCFETTEGCKTEKEPSSYYRQLDVAFGTLRSRLLGLKKEGAEIVILWTMPWGRWNVPAEMAKRSFLGLDTQDVAYIDRNEFERKAEPVKLRLEELASEIGGRFVDPLDFLCDDMRCPTLDRDGTPYYIDDQHIRSKTMRSARFRFLDDPAGISEQLTKAPEAVAASSKY